MEGILYRSREKKKIFFQIFYAAATTFDNYHNSK